MKIIVVLLVISSIVSGCEFSDDPSTGEGFTFGFRPPDPPKKIPFNEKSTMTSKLAIDERYARVENIGIRLVLSYDSVQSAFVGSMENVTDRVLLNVRVEIQLSNGVVFKNKPYNLAPSAKIGIFIDTTGQDFETWTIHAKID